MSVTAMSTNVSFTVVNCSPSSFVACTDSRLVIVLFNEYVSVHCLQQQSMKQVTTVNESPGHCMA